MQEDGDKNDHKSVVWLKRILTAIRERSFPWRNLQKGFIKLSVCLSNWQDQQLTIDDDGGSGATALRHNVLGHAGVVGCVGEPRLLDDQVVIDGDVEVPVVCRVDDLLVLQPLHLTGGDKVKKRPKIYDQMVAKTFRSFFSSSGWQYGPRLAGTTVYRL